LHFQPVIKMFDNAWYQTIYTTWMQRIC
jgi:hypothetical protein